MLISAYYFRAQMYTIVPSQVRQDMQWLADSGCDNVVLGILEQDFYAARENIDLVCKEAERVGISVFATPSRWGSLVAGCPKVPSVFSSTQLDAVMRKKDGSLNVSWLGPLASIHHPKTIDFFCDSLEKTLSYFPIKGIVWDEPKAMKEKDYSPAAREALAGKDLDDENVHIQAMADFFEMCNQHALSVNPKTRLCMFLDGNQRDLSLEKSAAITTLHDFGLDGRPYWKKDGGKSDSPGRQVSKTLLDDGPRFLEAARKNNKYSLFLVENHAMGKEDDDLMDKRLPEVLALKPDHLIFYYYPRSLEEPQRNMEIIANHLKKYK